MNIGAVDNISKEVNQTLSNPNTHSAVLSTIFSYLGKASNWGTNIIMKIFGNHLSSFAAGFIFLIVLGLIIWGLITLAGSSIKAISKIVGVILIIIIILLIIGLFLPL